MKKQVTAVVDEVKIILGASYDVSVPAKSIMSKGDVSSVQDAIFNGLATGLIECKLDITDVKALKTYANGLVTNHLRKCKLLNGNASYKASGAGPKRDERLRELNKVLSSGNYVEGSEQYIAIEEAIITRKSELSAARTAKTSVTKAADIDVSVLPPGLQDLVNNAT